MPYIDKKSRDRYEASLVQYIRKMPDIETKGDLEYLVFVLMQKFMKTREFRYSTLHEVVYAVMHCADEYRRRFLDKREDEARIKNGDVE
jgi:hypothetical protein